MYPRISCGKCDVLRCGGYFGKETSVEFYNYIFCRIATCFQFSPFFISKLQLLFVTMKRTLNGFLWESTCILWKARTIVERISCILKPNISGFKKVGVTVLIRTKIKSNVGVRKNRFSTLITISEINCAREANNCVKHVCNAFRFASVDDLRHLRTIHNVEYIAVNPVKPYTRY